MNILPTHPKYGGARYFNDMARLHCDVAYTAFYAQLKSDVMGGATGRHYVRFVREAHERGLPACIQVQSTLSNLDDLDIAESQYTVENIPHAFYASNVSSKRVCFASFASQAWKRLLNELTAYFVQHCGFDWIVYEEPMYAVDIPGTKDRFHAVFQERFPDSPYPVRHEESPAYLKVQLLKKDVLASFYRDLLAHAKSAGAKRCGIMPWFFVPIYENTPYETLDTSCDLGRIIQLPDLDFVVVRMQPDNIYAGATIDIPSQVGGRLYYTEVMAHQLGKPVICVNNAINEHREWFEFDAIPLEFFKESTLSAVAAAPDGMSHHWYVPRDLPHIEEHWELLAQTNEALMRLGRPQCQAAFLYSYRGTIHSWPYRNPQVFEKFWSLAKPMLFDPPGPYPTGERMRPVAPIPFKILYADSLEACLAANPDVRLLLIDEYYPLADAETAILRTWLEQPAPQGPRAALVFASGFGYAADPNFTGDRPLHEAWPALLDLCGFDPAQPARPRTPNRGRRLKKTTAARLPKPLEALASAYIFRCLDATRKHDTEVLIKIEEENLPYLTRARVGNQGGCVYTLCVGLWPRTLPPIPALVRFILSEIHAPLPDIDPGPGVLYNLTANGYLIATNPGAADSFIDVSDTRARYWNVRAARFEFTTRIPIPAYDFVLARRLEDGQRIVDVEGARIAELHDPPGGAQSRLRVDARGYAVVRLAEEPDQVLVNGRTASLSRLDSDPGAPAMQPGHPAAYSLALTGDDGPGTEFTIQLRWPK